MLFAAPAGVGAQEAARPGTGARLVDDAARVGLEFRFHSGTRGRHDLPEIMGGGAGFIDFDGDGWLDVYVCDGGPIGSADEAVEGHGGGTPCRLFRNDMGRRYVDVTETANAPGPAYAMGVAVGDVDGDGRDDLFVSGWGDQRLYLGLPGGTFRDATLASGLEDHGWTTSAAFADLDDDGDLDLYVCHYVAYAADQAPYCAAPDGKRDYCGPEVLPPQPDRLYWNDGMGRFRDGTAESGVLDRTGRGLGVLVADLVGDRRLDLFVVNDGSACRLYENRDGTHFTEVGQAAGVAFDGRGDALAGMGVAAGDLDGDGLTDLVVGNFLDRGTVAWRQVSHGLFEDRSEALGLRGATRSVLGFGLALVDLDGNGWLDLIQANGHVLDRARLGVPFAMRPTFLVNQHGRLLPAAASPGPFFEAARLGRGLAIGDWNRDGRPDVLVASLDQPLVLLRNASSGRGVSLELVQAAPRRGPALGAVVSTSIGGRQVTRVLTGGGSYLSASARELYLPLNDEGSLDEIEVLWPSGLRERWRSQVGEGRLILREGTGIARSRADRP